MTGRKKHIELYDTTLRDGAQMNGISFSDSDKMKLVIALDQFGIQFIEAGYPGSSPRETEFFAKLKEANLENATIVAFGMTCRKGRRPEEDKDLRALLSVGADVIALVGKASRFQVEEVLKTDLEENIRMIRESCGYLTGEGKAVFFDAEHFFDGYKQDAGYTLACVSAAIEGGAVRIIFCDTNGGSLPSETSRIVGQARKQINMCVPMGMHAHNDCGLAVANSIAALERGAIQVQGTINGYGERCGNADLIVLAANLQLKMGAGCFLPHQFSRLAEVSHFVAEIANVQHNPRQPYVGRNAFRHKGGMHGDGHEKHPDSYQHIDPKLVGNVSGLVVSGLAGKSIVKAKAAEFGIELSAEELDAVLASVKELEAEGFTFEGTDASLELLMLRHKQDYARPFEILRHRVTSEQSRGGKPKDEALLIVKINGAKKLRTVTVVAMGSGGPLSVIDAALRKALRPSCSKLIKDVRVVASDYKVRALGGDGVSSPVRVLIPFTDGKKTWTTVGCSRDSVGAKLQALVDGFEWAIMKSRQQEKAQ